MSHLGQDRLSKECARRSALPQRTDINRRDFRGRSVPIAAVRMVAGGVRGHRGARNRPRGGAWPEPAPSVIFEIIGRRGELASNAMLLRTRYAEGLTAYRAGCWDEARAAFNAGLAAVPGDGPSMTFVQRIDDLQKNGPPANWDGSWCLDRK
jgi:hypothetical protein